MSTIVMRFQIKADSKLYKFMRLQINLNSDDNRRVFSQLIFYQGALVLVFVYSILHTSTDRVISLILSAQYSPKNKSKKHGFQFRQYCKIDAILSQDRSNTRDNTD